MSFSVKSNKSFIATGSLTNPSYWSLDNSGNIINNNFSGRVGINNIPSFNLDICGNEKVNYGQLLFTNTNNSST